MIHTHYMSPELSTWGHCCFYQHRKRWQLSQMSGTGMTRSDDSMSAEANMSLLGEQRDPVLSVLLYYMSLYPQATATNSIQGRPAKIVFQQWFCQKLVHIHVSIYFFSMLHTIKCGGSNLHGLHVVYLRRPRISIITSYLSQNYPALSLEFLSVRHET